MVSQSIASTTSTIAVPSQQPQSTSKTDSVLITGLLFLIIGITIVVVG